MIYPSFNKMRLLPKQEKFADAVVRVRPRLGGAILLCGGIASGKTAALAYAGIDLASHRPGSLGLVGRKSFRELRETTLRAFLEIGGDKISSWDDAAGRMTFHDQSSILFRQLSDHGAVRDLELSWAAIDEAQEVDETTATWLCLALDRPRLLFATCDRNDESPWIKELWRHPQEGDRWPFPVEARLAFDTGMRENVYLPKEYVEMMDLSERLAAHEETECQ